MKEKRKGERRKEEVKWKRPRSDDLKTGRRVYKERRTCDRRKPNGR